MTEKSLYMADHFPCILMDFMQWYTCFQGHTAMLAQEFCDETDIFVLAEEKRRAPMDAISQKPHGWSKMVPQQKWG